MSPDQVMAVYSLGPNYMYAFLPSEVGCVPENVSTQSVIDSKDGLALKMIFGFNAQVIINPQHGLSDELFLSFFPSLGCSSHWNNSRQLCFLWWVCTGKCRAVTV
jgi:hypothetical protein